jgi:hypothetical protein
VPKAGSKTDLRRDLCDFPYRPAGWSYDRPFTRADFDAMDEQTAFKMCMSGLFTDSSKSRDAEAFNLQAMPYMVNFKDISGYYDNCHYCGETRCGGCVVPFSESVAVQSILEKLKI